MGRPKKVKEVHEVAELEEVHEVAELEYSKSYKVVSLVNEGFLKEGKEYNIAGKLAEKFINSNKVKLK